MGALVLKTHSGIEHLRKYRCGGAGRDIRAKAAHATKTHKINYEYLISPLKGHKAAELDAGALSQGVMVI